MDTQVVFNWLLQHGKKIIAAPEWEKLLNIHIIDSDGWRDKPFETPISLPEFIERASRSTLR